MSCKRFAFLLPSMSGGGAERVALRLIGDCLRAGHEVDLVLKEAKGELLSLVPREVRIFDLRASRIRSVVLPFRAYLRSRRPGSVHIMMWPLTIAGIIGWRLARSRARIITGEHTTLGRQYGGSRFKRAILFLTIRTFYPMAHKVLCVSQQSADDLAEISGLNPANIVVVHNPVAAPLGPIVVPESIDAMWGEGARILAVGSLKPAKNHAMLIRAFAQLARRRPAKLIIVGEGQMRKELMRVAAEKDVSDLLHMPGFTLNPWPYYASADLFVLSSDYEGFPLVMIEAMLCGLNVVSTDCRSGPREILFCGKFGKLTPVGSESELAHAMELQLDHPIDRADLVARAVELSGDHCASAFQNLMDDGPPTTQVEVRSA